MQKVPLRAFSAAPLSLARTGFHVFAPTGPRVSGRLHHSIEVEFTWRPFVENFLGGLVAVAGLILSSFWLTTHPKPVRLNFHSLTARACS